MSRYGSQRERGETERQRGRERGRERERERERERKKGGQRIEEKGEGRQGGKERQSLLLPVPVFDMRQRFYGGVDARQCGSQVTLFDRSLQAVKSCICICTLSTALSTILPPSSLYHLLHTISYVHTFPPNTPPLPPLLLLSSLCI